MIKRLVIIASLSMSANAFANTNCNIEAREAVARFSEMNPGALSVLGSFQGQLKFGQLIHSFVADVGDESLVYEVALAASDCTVEGIYRHDFYADEFETEKMEQYSIFKRK